MAEVGGPERLRELRRQPGGVADHQAREQSPGVGGQMVAGVPESGPQPGRHPLGGAGPLQQLRPALHHQGGRRAAVPLGGGQHPGLGAQPGGRDHLLPAPGVLGADDQGDGSSGAGAVGPVDGGLDDHQGLAGRGAPGV
ncbi:hypothetical protein [Kitasatospora albolonga]|uniref:hypothetical protein n=1 Tax=Kitasatospora albolonga TaxID=68173 RepID=UPI0035F09AD3